MVSSTRTKRGGDNINNNLAHPVRSGSPRISIRMPHHGQASPTARTVPVLSLYIEFNFDLYHVCINKNIVFKYFCCFRCKYIYSMKLIFSGNSCLLYNKLQYQYAATAAERTTFSCFASISRFFFYYLNSYITKDNYCAFILRHIYQYLTYECYFFLYISTINAREVFEIQTHFQNREQKKKK